MWWIMMNYLNGKLYFKNKFLDGCKSLLFLSNIEYGGWGMILEKDIE